jgi:hypothetical protein
MANDFKLMDSNSPTQQRNIKPMLRIVKFSWEIDNNDDVPYPCEIFYEMDERTREVFLHGVTFEYGFCNDGFKYLKEVVQEKIIEVEGGALDFLTEPIFE